MKESAGNIRVGWVIELNKRRYTVTSVYKVKPGKGGAFAQVEMKDIDTGSKGNERFRTEDTVEKLMVEDIDSQYLYNDGSDAYFMYLTSYEQFTMPLDTLGDSAKYLIEGMKVVASLIEGNPVSISLPQTVICTIAETEPVVKGQTAASSNKPAILDNGIRIMVPTFVNEGEQVVVNTEYNEYVERAKK